MNKVKNKIFEIIELDNDNESLIDECYAYFMIGVIITSLVPLFTRESNVFLSAIEDITIIVFVIDYVLRMWTADLKLKKGWKSYLKYPFSFFSIIDVLSIIPAFTTINNGFKALRALRVVKCLKVFKALRYSKSFHLLLKVFEREKDSLYTVFFTALGYVIITALIMYNADSVNFKSYFDALYWASTALTTVGYGDVYPVTDLGRWISMVSTFIGIAIVAIPSGIITAGYIGEVNDMSKEKNEAK